MSAARHTSLSVLLFGIALGCTFTLLGFVIARHLLGWNGR